MHALTPHTSRAQDERVVPHSSPDSNYKAVAENLLSKVPIPAANVHAILEGLAPKQVRTARTACTACTA